MKPLTLEQVFERIDKSLFDEVKLHNKGTKHAFIRFTDFVGGVKHDMELLRNGETFFDKEEYLPSEPQLLEIQKCQRELLGGEEE